MFEIKDRTGRYCSDRAEYQSEAPETNPQCKMKRMTELIPLSSVQFANMYPAKLASRMLHYLFLGLASELGQDDFPQSESLIKPVSVLEL